MFAAFPDVDIAAADLAITPQALARQRFIGSGVAEMTSTSNSLAFERLKPCIDRDALRAVFSAVTLLFVVEAPGVLVGNTVGEVKATAYLLGRRLEFPAVFEQLFV